MHRRLVVALGLLLVYSGLAFAQQVGPQDACRQLYANPSGIAEAPIVVSLTPVTILVPDASRCGALVQNSSTQNLRCKTFNNGLPSGTAGFKFAAGAVFNFGVESQTGLRCIRDSLATGDGSIDTWEFYQ